MLVQLKDISVNQTIICPLKSQQKKNVMVHKVNGTSDPYVKIGF